MDPAFLSAQKNDGPALSVVVVSCNTPRTLARCLAALSRQSPQEILVVDSSGEDPATSLRERFPNVEFRHFDRLSVPELRREGIQAARGEVIAVTESWMTPSENWVDSLRAAHHAFPEVPAIGGAITFLCDGERATTLEWADYFSEYGPQIPGVFVPRPECVPCKSLSGANVSYKRWAIERCRDLIAKAAWEPAIHERLQREGYALMRAPGAQVCYQRAAAAAELLQERFAHGRDHAAARLRDAGWAERWARGAAAPLVPWLMFWRLGSRIRAASDLQAAFWASAAWILTLYWAWAAGEAIGAWFGPARRP